MTEKNLTSTKPPHTSTKTLTLIGLTTAALCILGPMSIPIPVSPVPLSLTNFAIYLIIYILGMKHGTISVFIYLCVGTVGLPVFSAFSGGPSKLFGPTGGYLIGFLFLALIQGFLMERFPGKRTAAITGMILGLAVCYTFGTVWLAAQMNLGFFAALGIGVIPYLPGDAAKIIAAVLVGPKLQSALRRFR